MQTPQGIFTHVCIKVCSFSRNIPIEKWLLLPRACASIETIVEVDFKVMGVIH